MCYLSQSSASYIPFIEDAHSCFVHVCKEIKRGRWSGNTIRQCGIFIHRSSNGSRRQDGRLRSSYHGSARLARSILIRGIWRVLKEECSKRGSIGAVRLQRAGSRGKVEMGTEEITLVHV